MSRKALRFAAPALALVLLASAASAAQGATLALPIGKCALASQPSGNKIVHFAVTFGVAGLAPNAHYTVTANGAVAGSGTTNAAGSAVARFLAPTLVDQDRLYTIRVSDGITTATATTTFTTHSLTVKPRSGAPNRRVKISMYGFLGKTVYLHFIPPGKTRPVRTVKLGKTKGACGHLSKKLGHFYSTARPRAGHWKLVFDTHRHYKKTDPLRIVYRSTIRYF